MRFTRNQKYRVPHRLVQYLCGWPEQKQLQKAIHFLRAMQLNALPEVRFGGSVDEQALALELHDMGELHKFVQSVVVANTPYTGAEVDKIKKQILIDYADSVFKDRHDHDPPIRGPFGEATIDLKPGVTPIKQKPYQMQGERLESWKQIINRLKEDGKIEEGVSAWSSPSFTVPTKNPDKQRLVVDYRLLNDATITDAHPMPLIEHILNRQGKFCIWTVLDMKDGYHQVPLKKEHRHLTCMSTPLGTMQWKVLVMGLKNGGAIFQRMMEWVLQPIDPADPYVDDVIIGSTGKTIEEAIRNHEKDLRETLERLKEQKLLVNPSKAHFFMQEVEFCGHVLKEGRRQPAPGKLLSIQKWELPQTVTQLRGFLGLTNYYSSYVEHYADYAGPLMSKLQLNRQDGKKGLKKTHLAKVRYRGFRKAKRSLSKKT